MADHYTKEGEGQVGTIHTVEEARKAHHLATADPEPERGIGTETGPAHEKRFGLEREEGSAAAWRAAGVHPYENRALVEGEDGAENLRGAVLETADESSPVERATPAKPSRSR